MKSIKRKIINLFICAGLLVFSSLSFAQVYSVTEIGYGSWDSTDFTIGNAINDSEIVGGASYVQGMSDATSGYRAYYGSADTSVRATTLPDTGMYSRSDAVINDLSIGSLGVGYVGGFGSGARHAALFTYDHRIFEIGALPGDGASEALAVNNAGWVVGTSQNLGRAPRAFLWVPTASDVTRPGTMYELPCTEVGAGGASATSINLGGLIGGSCGGKPYLWLYGAGYDISSLLPERIDTGAGRSVDRSTVRWSFCNVASIADSYAFSVNCSYELTSAANQSEVAFVSTPAVPTLTQVPRTPGTTAADRHGDVYINSINNDGCAVGSAGIPTAPGNTAISYCGGVLTDLNTVAHSKTFYLYHAIDINNRGTILVDSIRQSATAVPSFARSYPVVLTPPISPISH